MKIKLLKRLKGILIALGAIGTLQSFALEDEADYSAAKKFDVPLRELSIIVSKEGYYPKVLTAFVGEKVRFYLTTSTTNPSCFIMNDMNLTLAISPQNITEGEVFFGRPGEFNFHCPIGKIFGKIQILPRPEKKKSPDSTPSRQVASQKPQLKMWWPKDE